MHSHASTAIYTVDKNIHICGQFGRTIYIKLWLPGTLLWNHASTGCRRKTMQRAGKDKRAEHADEERNGVNV